MVKCPVMLQWGMLFFQQPAQKQDYNSLGGELKLQMAALMWCQVSPWSATWGTSLHWRWTHGELVLVADCSEDCCSQSDGQVLRSLPVLCSVLTPMIQALFKRTGPALHWKLTSSYGNELRTTALRVKADTKARKQDASLALHTSSLATPSPNISVNKKV